MAKPQNVTYINSIREAKLLQEVALGLQGTTTKLGDWIELKKNPDAFTYEDWYKESSIHLEGAVGEESAIILDLERRS